MTSQKNNLGKLLNDESFIGWLKGTAMGVEKERWDTWLMEDSNHQQIVKKARKIVTMPFKTTDIPNTSEEVKKLKEQLKNKTI